MRLRIICLTAIAALLFSGRADACSCISQTPCKAFTNASAIFVGRMIGGTEKNWFQDPKGETLRYESGEVRFIVEQTFKGALGAEVTIYVPGYANTSCAYSLLQGERYLVYAYNDKNRSGRLWTGVCTRTSPLENAAEDLDFLRNLPPEGSGGLLTGTLRADEGTGEMKRLAGATVMITSESGQTIKIRTNEEGKFEIRNLKAGKYRVEPVWPAHYISESPFVDTIVSDRGCADLAFDAVFDCRVKGRVFDAAGRPAQLHIELSAADDPDAQSVASGYSKDDGTFEIVGMPPGRYRLYLEFRTDTDEWEERKYFYPGVWKPEEAKIIEVELGSGIDGLDFPIPPEYGVRTIEGQVVWPNGAPAAGVTVMLHCRQSTQNTGYLLGFWDPETKTDRQGRFRLQGFSGETYWLEASATALVTTLRIPVGMHSPPVHIAPQADVQDIKLTISEPGFAGECGDRMKKQ